MTVPTSRDGAASGEFRLDVELAERAIAQLESVRQRLAILRRDAIELAKTSITAHDPVSLEASALLARTADGGPGSFTEAMDAGIAHVNDLIDQVRADIAEQQELDSVAAAGLANRG